MRVFLCGLVLLGFGGCLPVFIRGSWDARIEAYALINEVAPGAIVPIAVSAEPGGKTYWVARRIGWYSGAGYKTFASGTVFTIEQPMPQADEKTGLIEAGWKPTLFLKTAADWPAGAYSVTFTVGNNQGTALFVINDGRKHDFLAQLSFTSYAAYNTWGGMSLYTNKLPGPKMKYASHVSLDRPFDNEGWGDFEKFERKIIIWLDRAGYDVGYTTNMGVDGNADLANQTNMLLSLGHDEYWSVGERDAVDTALTQGMHLTMLSGNSAYWRVNLLPSTDGRPKRVVECHRTGPDAESTHTRLWHQEGRSQGDLLGVVFGWIVDSWAPLVITDVSHPFFRGTDIEPGDSFPGIMGHEIDGYHQPISATVLGRAPLIDHVERLGNGAVVVRTLPSGSQIFSASTLRWGHALVGNYATYRLQRFTNNVLAIAGKPRISSSFSPNRSPDEIHRWLSATVTTAVRAEAPRSIVNFNGQILFVENGLNEVRELLPNGTLRSFARTQVELTGMTVDGTGRLWATDVTTDSIWRYDDDGFVRVSSGTKGFRDGKLAEARFATPVQIHAAGSRIVVTEHNRDQSRVRLIENGWVRTLPNPGPVVYTALPISHGDFLMGLASNTIVRLHDGEYDLFSGSTSGGWSDGNTPRTARYLTPYYFTPTQKGLFVVERYGHRIRFVSAGGGAWTVAGRGAGYEDGDGDRAKFQLPYGLVEGEPGTVYVSDAGNRVIRKITLHERP